MTEILLCQVQQGKLSTKNTSISFSSPVSKLIQVAEQFSKAPGNRLVLSYQGTVLSPTATLESYQISSGGLIMIAVLPEQTPAAKKAEPIVLSQEENKRLVMALKTAFKNPAFTTVVKRLLERDNMDSLIAACEGLGEDMIAQGFLTKPELLLHLLNPDTLEKVAKNHPSLLEAAKNLSAAVHEEQQSAGRTGENVPGNPEVGGGSYYLDEMSDDEMEEDGARGPQRSRSFNAITPAQLAQALASAVGGGSGQAGLQPFQGVTGMGIGAPSLAGSHGPSANTAPQSSASTPGSARITTDMFQQAIQQALMGMGAPIPPQSHESQGAFSSADTGSEDLASKVERMKEMGIVDEGLALQALQIMGGDLQAAVDLIFSGWEGGDDSMQ